MAHHSEYRQWPFLTPDEFELVCAYFDQRYIQANLGPTRKRLKISHRRVATTGDSYIEIIRLLQIPDDVGGLSSAFGKLSTAEEAQSTQEMDVDMTAEEEDEVINISFTVGYRLT
jgi:ubiquitin-like-conjugating enzyme ATG10